MKKSTRYGIIGSALSCIMVLLLLLFIVLPGSDTVPKEDEGIIVSFGDNETGSGKTDNPTAIPTVTPKVTPPPPVSPPVSKPIKQDKPSKQDLMTQSDNSLAVAAQKKKDKERKLQAEIEKQRETQRLQAIEKLAIENQRIEKLAIEKQRIETERRLETERRIADRKRNEQAAIDKANAMDGMFGNNNSNGSGTGAGDTRQGNPAGKGSSGGNSWSLNGRSLTGRLVSPSYDRNVEGKITVNIRVDENGSVVSATIGSPTTISDAETRNAATSAARNTHFTSGKGFSGGSITYNFNLK